MSDILTEDNVNIEDNIDTNKKTKRTFKNVDNRIVKCKLISILKNKEWLPTIKYYVKIINMIKTEAYFLFNQYILYLLKNNKDISFSDNTIERSVLFVLNDYKSIRTKDNEYDIMKDVYNNYYLPLGPNRVSKYLIVKSITNPFNYIATELITNIKNHLNIHFFKYQQLYVKTFIYDIFLKYKFSKSIYYALVNCILYNMNDYNA